MSRVADGTEAEGGRPCVKEVWDKNHEPVCITSAARVLLRRLRRALQAPDANSR
jgi:hypothetical protein